MMHRQSPEIIKKICFDIFEQLAFMFGEELKVQEVECPQDAYIQATMHFSGYKKGAVVLVIPCGLAPPLAANILGLDESAPMETGIAEDALKELLNTLCGRILPALFTDRETFDLHPPEAGIVHREQWLELLHQEHTIAFAIEDSPILLNLHFSDCSAWR